MQKETRLQRALLQLGVNYKAHLDAHIEKLSAGMKIQYALVAESFESQLAELGPDPLSGFEVSDAGSSVDEARLIRMGWEAIFDHENKIFDRDPKRTHINNGILELHSDADRNIPHQPMPGWTSIKLRIKTDKLKSTLPNEAHISWVSEGTFKTKSSLGVYIRDPNMLVIKGQNPIEIDPKAWTDITFTYNKLKKEASVSVNGAGPAVVKDFPKPVSLTIWLEPGSAKQASILQIQSVLGQKD